MKSILNLLCSAHQDRCPASFRAKLPPIWLIAIALSIAPAQHALAQEDVTTVCVAAPLFSKAFNVGRKSPAYRLNEYIISTPYKVMENAARMKSGNDKHKSSKGVLYEEQNKELKAASRHRRQKNEFVVVRPPYVTDLYHTCDWHKFYPVDDEYALSNDRAPVRVRGNMCAEKPEIVFYQYNRSFEPFVASLYDGALINGEPLSYYDLNNRARSTFEDAFSLIRAVMNVRAVQCGNQPAAFSLTMEKENPSPTDNSMSSAYLPIYKADLILGSKGLLLVPREDEEARRIANLTKASITRLRSINDWESRLEAGAPALGIFLFSLGMTRTILQCDDGEMPVNGQC